MKKYNHQAIEKKWQEKWEEQKLYQTVDGSKKPKFYCLVEFPYPSAEGLHVGHPRSYTAMDILARKRRMQGYNVLFPIGFDAFGLPAENYAIKKGIHPRITTQKNISNFRQQLKSLGYFFDWSREISTIDPAYYKWTQWIFLQLYKKGLAYKKEMPINWCPSCKIGLANEEVVGANCERCGMEVTKKILKQWLLKITKYADRLIDDLDTVDYLEKIKTQQINWIGRSAGALIKFPIANFQFSLDIFTTRPDTLFGATYLVVAPEHDLVKKLKKHISNYAEVEECIKNAARKSDLERTELAREKTGVELKGVKAINPANHEEIPIWVADYVLAAYGTGAIMAVPAHDLRDFEFAKKFKLPIRCVINPVLQENVNPSNVLWAPLKKYTSDLTRQHPGYRVYTQGPTTWDGKKAYKQVLSGEFPYFGDGVIINSGDFNGLDSQQGIKQITNWLEKNNLGKKYVNYKLRDWIFSRQHYWGEPIPIVYCKKCGEVPVPEKDLPILLPEVKKYQPTETGASPLAAIKDWVHTTCPKCGGPAQRETDTMPTWAGSSWYFLRYCDPRNSKVLADKKKLKHWLPVDWYNGGMEHTTLHLLYSRFWHKFLYDIGVVPTVEPYQKRTSQGMILGEDNQKMSKSRGNVVNPDDIVKEYGADTMRLYEMFIGPFADAAPWSNQGIMGVRRFLERVEKIIPQVKKKGSNQGLENILHKTIKKVSEDIEGFRFNTAISCLMELVNFIQKPEFGFKDKKEEINLLNKFLILLSPFAPHLAEELWERWGHQKSIFLEKWPKYDEDKIRDETVDIVVQINGKVRGKFTAGPDITKDEAKKLALAIENVKRYIDNERDIVKAIFVRGKLINFVVKIKR